MTETPPSEPLRRGRDPGFVLALIAHDQKKDALLSLARRHRDTLLRLRLVATGTSGGLIRDELELPIELMRSGPYGGDLQIGALIAEGAVDAVAFLRDPLTAHAHEPDIQALLKVCDVNEVPVATNDGMAQILLEAIRGRVVP